MNVKTRLLKELFDEIYEFNQIAQNGLKHVPVFTSAFMEKKKTEFEKSFATYGESATFAQDRYVDDIRKLLKDLDRAIAEQRINEGLSDGD